MQAAAPAPVPSAARDSEEGKKHQSGVNDSFSPQPSMQVDEPSSAIAGKVSESTTAPDGRSEADVMADMMAVKLEKERKAAQAEAERKERIRKVSKREQLLMEMKKKEKELTLLGATKMQTTNNVRASNSNNFETLTETYPQKLFEPLLHYLSKTPGNFWCLITFEPAHMKPTKCKPHLF